MGNVNDMDQTGTGLYPGLSPVITDLHRFHPVEFVVQAQHILERLSQLWNKTAPGSGNSLLTPGGYPLEFNFSTSGNDLSYTADPGDPAMSVSEKWEVIRQFLPGMGTALSSDLESLRHYPGQRFGCWMSFRHLPTGLAHKIYQEIPQAAFPLIFSRLEKELPGIRQELLAPMLLGIFPGNPGIAEYYFKLRGSNTESVQPLLRHGEVQQHVPLLYSFLSELASEQIQTLIRRLHLGLSYRVCPGKMPEITLFAHAAQLFRNNSAASRSLIILGRHLGGQLSDFEQLARLDRDDKEAFAYSVVSFKLARERVDLSFGWRPRLNLWYPKLEF